MSSIPTKIAEFEEYGRRLDRSRQPAGRQLITAIFCRAEGASNIAYAMFSFPSLAAYEDYRQRMAKDPECQEVLESEKLNRSIVSYERSFLRPVFE